MRLAEGHVAIVSDPFADAGNSGPWHVSCVGLWDSGSLFLLERSIHSCQDHCASERFAFGAFSEAIPAITVIHPVCSS